MSFSKETQGILDEAMELAKNTYPQALRYVSPAVIGLCLVRAGGGELAAGNRGEWDQVLQTIIAEEPKQPKGLPRRVAMNKVSYSKESKDLFDRCEKLRITSGALQIEPSHLFEVLFTAKNSLIDMKALTKNFDFSAAAPAHVAPASSEEKKSDSAILNEHCRNISDMAELGQLDPVIGREIEIRNTIRVLLKRKKNNPILIGEAGVGKTAIVEGLAQRLIESDSPMLDSLRGRSILELDLMSLMGGTGLRGELEKRLKQLVDALSHESNNTILFIDEIHNLVGSGSSEGSGDIANFLKPALARGEMQVVGATTLAEYKKFIEPDPALMRRFDRVIVPEPTEEETLEILRRILPKFESVHGVKYQDEVLERLPPVARSYFGEVRLPDSAINLLDKLGASVRLEAALLKEAAAEGEELPTPEVNIDALARIVEDEKGVPQDVILQSPAQRLRTLPDVLEKDIIGQAKVKQALVEVFSEAGLGIHRKKRSSVVSLLFSGPSGSGKSFTAECLGNFLFPGGQDVMTFDMSNYTDTHSVQSLKGPPVGIVGHEKGGILTEFVKLHPYCMLIFQDIDKAHPEALAMIKEIYEQGSVTDSDNISYPLHNGVVVLTSESEEAIPLTGLSRTCHFEALEDHELGALMQREVVAFLELYASYGYNIDLPVEFGSWMLGTHPCHGDGGLLIQNLEELLFSVIPAQLLQKELEPGDYKIALNEKWQVEVHPGDADVDFYPPVPEEEEGAEEAEAEATEGVEQGDEEKAAE